MYTALPDPGKLESGLAHAASPYPVLPLFFKLIEPNAAGAQLSVRWSINPADELLTVRKDVVGLTIVM
jgi:hypothetical protein